MTSIEQLVTQQYTVRANRGKSRIWIQGKRLAGAGFVPGRQYSVRRVTATPGTIPGEDRVELRLIRDRAHLDGCHDAGLEIRKVSGKGELPIIDLSGKGCAPFVTGDDVMVEYVPGVITIRRAS